MNNPLIICVIAYNRPNKLKNLLDQLSKISHINDKPEEKKFKTHKEAKPKTSLEEVIFNIQTTDVITDNVKKSELEKIFSIKNKITFV